MTFPTPPLSHACHAGLPGTLSGVEAAGIEPATSCLLMVSAAGVDLHAPAVLAAKACVGASHGTINAAEVEQAAKTGQ